MSAETAVQLHQAKEPAVVLTKDDIRRYICPTADDKEIFMFLGICKSFGLNPLKREVHLIKYGNAPASIVTGYEVYLKRAERTNKLNGWKVEVDQHGKAATVTIHRKDWTLPFEWTAYRHEFDKGQANWKTMPLFMLRKVAMAQAFRICFPDEMGGLPYLPEEISGNISESLPAGAVDTTQETAAVPPGPKAAAPGGDSVPPASPPPTAGKTISDVAKELEKACISLSGLTGRDIDNILDEYSGFDTTQGRRALKRENLHDFSRVKDITKRVKWLASTRDKVERAIEAYHSENVTVLPEDADIPY